MKKRPSIRARLLLWTTILTTVILLLAGFFLYGSVRKLLQEQHDQILDEAATVVMIEIEAKDAQVYHEWKESLESHPWQRTTTLIQVTDFHSGESVRSVALGDFNLENQYGELGERVFYDLTLPDGSVGRAVGVLTLPIIEHEEGNQNFDPTKYPQIFVWAADTKNLQENLARFRKVFVLSGVAVLLLLWGAIWAVIHFSSRAVRVVTDEVLSREGSEIGRPIPVPDSLPSEVAGMANKFNELLVKIDHSREKDRDFFLNLAHEVRTPLAGVRAEIEQALRKPRENEDYRQRLERALEGTVGLNALVNRLMKFGSLRSKEDFTWETVDVRALLLRIWNAFEPRADERDLTVDWELSESLKVESDPELVKIVITNLLENAISYSQQGSVIAVRSKITEGTLFLTIENAVSQHGVNPEELEKFFDPFYRKDQSRGQKGSHAGIGLSFCREIMNLLEGEITASQPEERKIVFEVSIPVSP